MNNGKKIRWEILSNGCWKCSSHSTDYNGYPRITRNGKLENLTRYVYKINNGNLLDTEIVRHTCDFPTCINPEHLIKGSYMDNMNDRNSRNRTALGEKNGQSKLKEWQVKEIRNNPDISLWTYARKFNVGFSTVRYARNKITWKHI